MSEVGNHWRGPASCKCYWAAHAPGVFDSRKRYQQLAILRPDGHGTTDISLFSHTDRLTFPEANSHHVWLWATLVTADHGVHYSVALFIVWRGGVLRECFHE